MIDYILVNGEKTPFQVEESDHFEQLIEKIYQKFNNSVCALSSLKINGIEISPDTEELLKGESIQNVDQVEVVTIHTSEIVQETLVNVKDSIGSIISLSKKLSHEPDSHQFHIGFTELVDRLETVFEAISLIQQYWKLEKLPLIEEMEKDLIGILSQLVKKDQSHPHPRIKSILKKELPEALELWWDVAIPTLMRSKDC